MRIRLYFDEDSARHSLVRELRVRDADVITPAEAGMARKTDEEQLEWAAFNNRAIYSFNRGDFYRLHTNWLREGRSHHGIILSGQDLPVGEQMRRLLRLIHRLTTEEGTPRKVFMPKQFADITRDAIQLPRQQRLALASFLLELEDASGDSEADAVWEEEILARIHAIDNGTAVGISYEEVMREAQKRLAP